MCTQSPDPKRITKPRHVKVFDMLRRGLGGFIVIVWKSGLKWLVYRGLDHLLG